MFWYGWTYTHHGDIARNFEEMCYHCDDDLDEASEDYWTSFTKLCDNEYSSRVWVVQEILLGRQIQVMAQDITFYSAQSSLVRDALNRIKRSTFTSLGHDCGLLRPKRAKTLESILRKYGNSKCSDVRDQVFGFLGHTIDVHLVEFDYSQEENALWADVTGSYPAKTPANFGRYLEKYLELYNLAKQGESIYEDVEEVDRVRESKS